MRYKPNSRSQRMLVIIAARGKAKFTLADMQAGEFKDFSLSTISSVVNGLVIQRFVKRHGSGRGAQYSADTKKIADHFAAIERANNYTPPKARTAPTKPQSHRIVTTDIRNNTYCKHRLASADIADDIADFQRRGGRIQHLAPDARSRPIGD